MLAFHNGRITTFDRSNPEARAVLIDSGKFVAVGSDDEIHRLVPTGTRMIDLRGQRCVPGLHDSHIHLIRGGLNFNLELRWDGVRSLADAMAMLKAQVARTPAPQWVRVVGGFTAHQFVERRLPTLEELNEIAPHTPVFILHLYDRALLNAAALRVVGYTKDSQNPPGGEISRDSKGNPTGLLIASPNALILYSALAKGPKLSPEDQVNSTRMFMRELNRLGVTSVIDAGGGFQNYPDDYQIIENLAAKDELTVRIAYNLFTQNKGKELGDFQRWTDILPPLSGDGMYRHNGAGEMLVFSAADFEDFRLPRPEMSPEMEPDLEAVVRHLVEKRWPFRLHATYDETISRALDVYERVNREVPFDGLHFIIDHAETITPRNIERIGALGGGIAIQHRMAYQGEYFAERYGHAAATRTPPLQRMLAAGVPIGAGTDATRVASYNPWVALQWMVTGKTFSGYKLYGADNILDRYTAMELWTVGSSWFSNDEGRKGRIAVGQFADLAVLSRDYFTVPEDDIADIVADLTVVNGRVVHGRGDFEVLAPPAPIASPDWSPVKLYGGYQPAFPKAVQKSEVHGAGCRVHVQNCAHQHGPASMHGDGFWGALGCSCWAF